MPNNRDRLIAAASALFHGRGYDGTSLDDIQDATGIARSNLYYHFASKLELARAVVEHWIAVYDAQIVNPSLNLADARSASAQIESLFSRACCTQDPDCGLTGCPLGRLSVDLAAEDPGIRERVDEYFSGVERRVAEVLLSADGECWSTAQAQAMGRLTVAALEGALLLSGLRRRHHDLTSVGRALTELLSSERQGSSVEGP